MFEKFVNDSWEKYKGNHRHEEVFIYDKTHVDFHKTSASIFSASIPHLYWKFSRKQTDQMGIKWVVEKPFKTLAIRALLDMNLSAAPRVLFKGLRDCCEKKTSCVRGFCTVNKDHTLKSDKALLVTSMNVLYYP